MNPEFIGPVLGLAGIVIGGLIVGSFAIHNRRRGNVEIKMPSVAESWDEARLAQKDARESDRKLSNLRQTFDALLQLFRAYVYRVQHGGHIHLTAAESAALQLPDATDEDYPTITPQQLDELRP